MLKFEKTVDNSTFLWYYIDEYALFLKIIATNKNLKKIKKIK